MHLYEDDDDDDADSWSNPDDDSFDEDPDSRDMDGENDVKCVHCGRYISDQADLCPFCKMWQSDEKTRERKPLWFVITVAFCVAALTGAVGVGAAYLLGWWP
jgi:RNA polymerase subunit RPABC4/transcription elongation factor Spt4